MQSLFFNQFYKMNKLSFLLLIISLMACYTNQKATTEAAKPQAVVNLFSVSFISIGGGTDAKAIKTYNHFIEEFEINNTVKLSFEKVNWGKEGESDYCFDFSQLTSTVKDRFITETKKTLANVNLVRYAENTACRTPRK